MTTEIYVICDSSGIIKDFSTCDDTEFTTSYDIEMATGGNRIRPIEVESDKIIRGNIQGKHWQSVDLASIKLSTLEQRVREAEEVEGMLAFALRDEDELKQSPTLEHGTAWMGLVGETWYVFHEGNKAYEGLSPHAALTSLTKDQQ